MFRWLGAKVGNARLVSDTEKTLSGLRTLPEGEQRVIAINVFTSMTQSVRQLEATPGPTSEERDRVSRGQLSRAQAARHLAIRRGAKTWSDPDWAEAAIIEGWLMANTGALGRKKFDEITALMMAWLRSVLSDTELEAIVEAESGRAARK
jgi:hypothetical protein